METYIRPLLRWSNGIIWYIIITDTCNYRRLLLCSNWVFYYQNMKCQVTYFISSYSASWRPAKLLMSKCVFSKPCSFRILSSFLLFRLGLTETVEQCVIIELLSPDLSSDSPQAPVAGQKKWIQIYALAADFNLGIRKLKGGQTAG